MKTKSPSIINGIQTIGPYRYQYTGLQLGKVQFRVYEDREGWFVNSEFTPETAVKGPAAKRIKTALDQSGVEAFRHYLTGVIEKWKLKELAGV